MHDALLTVDAIAASVRAACAEEGDATRRAQLDEMRRLLVAYDDVLAAHGVVDYGGLITRTIALLRSDAASATSWSTSTRTSTAPARSCGRRSTASAVRSRATSPTSRRTSLRLCGSRSTSTIGPFRPWSRR